MLEQALLPLRCAASGPVAVDALDAGDAELRDLGEQPVDDRRLRVVGIDQYGEPALIVVGVAKLMCLSAPSLYLSPNTSRKSNGCAR